jgi:hypothetical protein
MQGNANILKRERGTLVIDSVVKELKAENAAVEDPSR